LSRHCLGEHIVTYLSTCNCMCQHPISFRQIKLLKNIKQYKIKNVCYYLNKKKRVSVLFYFMDKVKIKFVKKEKK